MDQNKLLALMLGQTGAAPTGGNKLTGLLDAGMARGREMVGGLLGRPAPRQRGLLDVMRDVEADIERSDQPLTIQATAVDQRGFPVDLGRPFVQLRDGGMGTEYQMTERIGDRWYNFPTIWDGVELSPDEAYARMLQDMGRTRYPNFATLEEAEREAERRSRYIGELRNMTPFYDRITQRGED